MFAREDKNTWGSAAHEELANWHAALTMGSHLDAAACRDSSQDPDLHDGYTCIRLRRKPASAMQPRPRLTIVVTETDEARLRALLKERRHAEDAALVRCLEAELAYAAIVAPHLVAPDVVTMNSCVVYESDRKGPCSKVRLVYPGDTHSRRGVSVLTPLGIALLGARLGQTVMWSLPNRQIRRLRVIALPYQPERSGDFHL